MITNPQVYNTALDSEHKEIQFSLSYMPNEINRFYRNLGTLHSANLYIANDLAKAFNTMSLS